MPIRNNESTRESLPVVALMIVCWLNNDSMIKARSDMMKLLSGMICLMAVSWPLMACTPHDATYFKQNPKALQSAIAECPNKAPKGITCDALHEIAIKVNEWVYELRMNPQGFGDSILSLQQTLAKDSLTAIQQKKIQDELRDRLAIVSWLESPGSSA